VNRDKVAATLAAQKILQEVAQNVQERAHQQIAEIVSKCLATVFEDPYTFRIIFEKKRGKTEARLAFMRGLEEFSPRDVGGGVVDVAAFALRLACMLLTRPPVRRVLIADEPFRFLSQQYRPRMRHLLETLAKDMGVQFILVTHAPDLVIGNVIDLE